MAANKKQVQHDAAGFPLLSFVELKDCLLALGISVTAEDISKPSPQTTQMIYGQLVDILMAVPLESMEGPRNSLLGMMEHRDIYADALQFTMFFRYCKRLAAVCGVKTLVMMDLLRPEPARTRTILSGIMNFAKWRENQSHFQGTLLQKVHSQTERMEKLRKEVAAIEYDIEEIKSKAEADKPKIEEAKQVNEVMRADMAKLHIDQAAVANRNEELKRERTILQDRTSAWSSDITQITQKLASTRSRLVQSPDRIKRTITEMSTNLSTEKTTLGSHQRKTRELQNRLDIINNLERDLRDLIELSRGIVERRRKFAEAERVKSTTIARLESKKVESQSWDTKLSQLERYIQRAQGRLTRQLEGTTKMQEDAQKKIKGLKEEYVSKTKDRNLWIKKRDHLKAQQAELEAQMTAFINKHETELNALVLEYAAVRNQTEEYMDTIAAKLDLDLDVRT